MDGVDHSGVKIGRNAVTTTGTGNVATGFKPLGSVTGSNNTSFSRNLELSPFTEADITPAYLGWLNDPVLMRYSNQRFRHHTYDTCRAYLDTFAGTDNLFLAVKANGEMVGTMTAYVNARHGTADMGILIGQQGRGYGQQAWDMLLNALPVRKVTAGTLACNMAMVRILERSGMTLEGTRRAQEIVDGEPQDILLFGKMK